MSYKVNHEEITHTTVESVYLDDDTVARVHRTESIYIDEEAPCDAETLCEARMDFNVSKAREDQQLVSGWANVALDANGDAPLDWQGDTITPCDLEKAAVQFMLNYRESGTMHKGASKGTVVESIVLTKEKQAAIGIPEGVVPEGWFITVKVHDRDVFEKVKDGTYRMFSIQGKAKRVAL